MDLPSASIFTFDSSMFRMLFTSHGFLICCLAILECLRDNSFIYRALNILSTSTDFRQFYTNAFFGISDNFISMSFLVFLLWQLIVGQSWIQISFESITTSFCFTINLRDLQSLYLAIRLVQLRISSTRISFAHR